jgi:glucokinase
VLLLLLALFIGICDVVPDKKSESDTCAIALDVGGTFLKSAIVKPDGSILEGTFRKTCIDSQGSSEQILETFTLSLGPHLTNAEEVGAEACGIGVGIPGPFDYEKGVSLIRHKFGAIYGVNLKEEFIKRLELPRNFNIRFENDAWTFLRGESWLGAAKGCTRTVGITLGTGLGSAFMVGDRVILGGPGVPPNGSVYDLPYDGGIVEDKISRRGIITRYKELAGRKYREGLDVKDIAIRGLKYKDEFSSQVFDEVGHRLGQVLKQILLEFRAECLIMGGQISKSFVLFSNPLQEELQSVPTLKKITSASKIDLSPIYGAAKLVFLGSSYRPPDATA